MKKILMLLGCMAVCCAMFVGCDNGGGIATDGPFGKLPQIFDTGYQKAMELREKGFSLTNTEEAGKMAEELLALKDQIDKDVEAEKAVLQDKELTTEVAEGIPFKLEGQAKIVKVADLDRVDLECAGELTEGGDLSKADEFDYTKLVVVAYDKEGKPIHAGGSFKYDVSTYKAKGTWAYEAGVKGKMEYAARLENYNYKQWANFGKLVVMSKSSEAYKQAVEQLKNAEKAQEELEKAADDKAAEKK